MQKIVRTIERVAPTATLLNYTNPSRQCSVVRQVRTSTVPLVGLCHQCRTALPQMLARWIGAPMNEINYTCAGIDTYGVVSALILGMGLMLLLLCASSSKIQ
jgi:alpha-galactosidase